MGMIYHKKRSWAKMKDKEEETLPYPESDNHTNDQQEENKMGSYTKTDINRMTTAELQELATNVGIENAHEKSGEKLKKALIEYFNL